MENLLPHSLASHMTAPDTSPWKNMFSSNKSQLLDYDEYRLKITNLGEKTSITFMNNESEPFDAKMVTQLFKPFEQVMTEDGLDI